MVNPPSYIEVHIPYVIVFYEAKNVLLANHLQDSEEVTTFYQFILVDNKKISGL